MLDKRLDAALILENVLALRAFIHQADSNAGVEKRKLAQAASKNIVVKFDVGEGITARLESKRSAGTVRGADLF